MGNVSKSKGVYFVLWLIGCHRFYLGKVGTGILYWLTGAGMGLWGLIDLFTLGSQVNAYNTNVELKTIRTNTIAQQQQNITNKGG